MIKWQDMASVRGDGIEEGKIEVARNMLKEGMEIPFVAKITGFSVEEVKKISEEIGY